MSDRTAFLVALVITFAYRLGYSSGVRDGHNAFMRGFSRAWKESIR